MWILVVIILLLIWGNLSRKSPNHPLNRVNINPQYPLKSNESTVGDNFNSGNSIVAGVSEPCGTFDTPPLIPAHAVFPINPPPIAIQVPRPVIKPPVAAPVYITPVASPVTAPVAAAPITTAPLAHPISQLVKTGTFTFTPPSAEPLPVLRQKIGPVVCGGGYCCTPQRSRFRMLL